MSQLGINIKRLESELLELSKIGFNEEDQGVYRQSFSKADLEARVWLLKLMEKEGLKAKIDGAGNVVGRYGPENGKPTILIISHLDSVPCGGIFDGTLGVMAGLECVRVIKESKLKLNHPVEVIATQDEEGRFGGMFGAQSLTGNLTKEWIEQASDISGESLKSAMEKAGFNPYDALSVAKDPQKVKACLELHIEQGPVLEMKKMTIGVVEGISGVFKWLVRLIGKADHAGTAPMDMRSDAFMGLADFAHEIYRICDEDGTDKSRLTIGRVDLKPGFAHTVPGEVDFSLVGRDLDEEIMNKLADRCFRVLSSIARKHQLKFEYDQKSWLGPRKCDPSIIEMIEASAKEYNYSYLHMPSGAGHDTQFFTEICPSGLIFIPSLNGVSHAPDEWSSWNDVEKGTNVLLSTLLKVDQS